jgi:hypothetical protein
VATGDPLRTYRDDAGWSISYPADLQLERSRASLRVSIEEVTVASFKPRSPLRTGRTGSSSWLRIDPPTDSTGRFPADGNAVRVLRREGGRAPNVELPETRLPLELDALPASSAEGGKLRPALERDLVGNGFSFRLQLWIAPDAPAEARRRLAEVGRSIRFRPLTTGEVVGHGFTVLERADSYPLRSVTRVHAGGRPFHLVHAPGGWYALGWRGSSISGGYKGDCDVRFERSRFLFTCPELGAEWDRVGRVVTRPAGASLDDPLEMTVAKVAHDGHVLLHPGVVRFADERLARVVA